MDEQAMHKQFGALFWLGLASFLEFLSLTVFYCILLRFSDLPGHRSTDSPRTPNLVHHTSPWSFSCVCGSKWCKITPPFFLSLKVTLFRFLPGMCLVSVNRGGYFEKFPQNAITLVAQSVPLAGFPWSSKSFVYFG